MADKYIGRFIGLQLKDGSSAEGILSDIDVQSGTLTLYQSKITKPDGREVTLSAFAPKRDEIADIKLLGRQKQSSRDSSPSVMQTDDSSVPNSTISHRHQDQQGQNGGGKAASQGKSKKKNGSNPARLQDSPAQQAQQRPRSASPVKRTQSKSYQVHGLQKDQPIRPSSASGLDKDGHFDFNAGLLQFDKAKVFQEIRDNDQSDPAQLLVSHNKRNQNERYTTKLLPSENVLDDGERNAEPLTVANAINARAVAKTGLAKPSPLSSEATPDSSFRDGMAADVSASSGVVDASQSQRSPDSGSIDGNRNGLNKQTDFRALDSNAICSALSTDDYKELLKVTNTETGPSAAQRIENGARGIAHYILHTVASPKRGFFTSSTPSSLTIAILAGSCTKAHYGLRLGSHLANKGVNVVAWLPSQSANLDTAVRALEASGGRVIQDVADLPSNPSLIVDAMSDSSEDANSFKTKRKPVAGEGEAVLYANSNSAPTLSIDAPSFLNPEDGTSMASYNIQPRFSMVLGAFRPIHQIPRVVGELVLIDLGIPWSAYHRVQKHWPRDLWGSEWVAPCIRA